MADNGAKIIELDRQRMTAFARMDIANAKALLSDDLIFTHVSSLVDTKENLIGKMESGEIVYSLQEPSDVKAQDYGNVVVLTGSARINVTANQTPYKLKLRFTNVWANHAGKWQMVAWHSCLFPPE
jgi:ketosteroid isomerase-like protein